MNRWLLAAALWFAAGVYGLIFREADGAPPPIAHFDKIAHAGLFFGQFWLLAKGWRQRGRRIPYVALWLLALLLAGLSEWAQGALTLTRSADWRDAVADMAGASAALWLAWRVSLTRRDGE